VDAANVAEEVTAEVMKRLKPKQFYRTAVTPVVGGHAGPGTIGLGFYTEV
jgi:fatty acid-binding protein DegV